MLEQSHKYMLFMLHRVSWGEVNVVTVLLPKRLPLISLNVNGYYHLFAKIK